MLSQELRLAGDPRLLEKFHGLCFSVSLAPKWREAKVCPLAEPGSHDLPCGPQGWENDSEVFSASIGGGRESFKMRSG